MKKKDRELLKAISDPPLNVDCIRKYTLNDKGRKITYALYAFYTVLCIILEGSRVVVYTDF